MSEYLSDEEKQTLLRLARTAVESAVRREALPPLDSSTLTPTLLADGASFVTLTKHGQLCGCIGSLEPTQPLAQDVRQRAMQAAVQDYRFSPVTAGELSQIQIEVSRLTRPTTLDYATADELLQKLRPNIDGVILRDGIHRATFLPQVWQQISNPAEFLSRLCLKMGAAGDLWQRKHLDVLIYQVEEFHE